jgi:hypothetical protein
MTPKRSVIRPRSGATRDLQFVKLGGDGAENGGLRGADE